MGICGSTDNRPKKYPAQRPQPVFSNPRQQAEWEREVEQKRAQKMGTNAPFFPQHINQQNNIMQYDINNGNSFGQSHPGNSFGQSNPNNSFGYQQSGMHGPQSNFPPQPMILGQQPLMGQHQIMGQQPMMGQHQMMGQQPIMQSYAPSVYQPPVMMVQNTKERPKGNYVSDRNQKESDLIMPAPQIIYSENNSMCSNESDIKQIDLKKL